MALPVTRSSSKLAEVFQLENPTMKDILAVSKAILDKINASETVLSKQFDSLNDTVCSLGNELSGVKINIDQLENKVEKCNSQIQSLENEVAALKQQPLQNDIVISGFPSLDYKVGDVVDKLNQLLQFDINNIVQSYKKQINVIDRINTGTKTFMHIIITFKSHAIKSDFLLKLRNNGPLYLDQLFPNQQNNKQIFVYERMTVTNVKLIKTLNHLKRDKKIAHVWFRSGKIFARIKEGDRSITIKSNDDITKLIA